MPFMTSGQEMEQALFLQPQSPHEATTPWPTSKTANELVCFIFFML